MKRKTLEYIIVGQKVKFVKYNEEVSGWTSSSKNPECPPDTKNQRDELFRKFKKKVKTRHL